MPAAPAKKVRPSLLRRTVQKTGDTIYHACNRTLLAFHAPLCFADFYRRARPLVDADKADIYHAHDLNTLPVAYWYARRHRSRLVYDSHELYTERNSKTPLSPVAKFSWRSMESNLIRKSHAVITVNTSIAKELAKRYKVRVPTVVMNTPPRTVQPSPDGNNLLRAALPIAPDQKLLIYSGAVTFNRGLEKVIESLIHLPDCYLVMMGYGIDKYKESLVKIVEKHSLGNRFSFYGPVAPDLVTMYAAGADLGLAPIQNACLSYYLCSPNKLFEYVIAGIPVIASDFPELRDVVSRFQIGVTFDPENPRDIARAADEILRNPEKAAAMRRNTASAADVFNWENESTKLLELYRSLK
jgi:glycosyltransferase involved in cell wall biosynthesis